MKQRDSLGHGSMGKEDWKIEIVGGRRGITTGNRYNLKECGKERCGEWMVESEWAMGTVDDDEDDDDDSDASPCGKIEGKWKWKWKREKRKREREREKKRERKREREREDLLTLRKPWLPIFPSGFDSAPRGLMIVILYWSSSIR